MGYAAHSHHVQPVADRATVVEFDLKARSMFPGKKGFDRLVYASKNVLSSPVTWLFYNCGKSMCGLHLESMSRC